MNRSCAGAVRDEQQGPELRQAFADYCGELNEGAEVKYTITEGRRVWLQVARGIVRLNGDELREGDGAAITDEPEILLDTDHHAEVLLFDLA